MSNADSTNGNHHFDEDRKEPKDRIDANPPCRAGKVVRLRKLLAELIARRIIAARRGPPSGVAARAEDRPRRRPERAGHEERQDRMHDPAREVLGEGDQSQPPDRSRESRHADTVPRRGANPPRPPRETSPP